MIKLFRETRKDLMKKKNFLSYILYALGEVSLIVIGILLALYLQNRNEEKKTQESIATTLNLLKDEISANKNKIAEVKDYHIMIRDTLQRISMPETEKGMGKTLSFWQGMRTPRLQNAAFQTSIQSGVSKDFNPVLLKTLNNLYTYQDSYNEFTSSSTQIFFNTDLTDVKSIKKTFALIQMTMNDFYYYEKGLTETYNDCLKEIDSLYP